MPQIYMITIIGPDEPGQAAGLTKILAEEGVNILDINQSISHSTLLFGMLVRMPENTDDKQVLANLTQAADGFGLNVMTEPISDEAYSAWVDQQGKPRYTITLLARRISAQRLAAVTQIISDQGLNIATMERLSGRPCLANLKDPIQRASIEFHLRGEPKDKVAMQAALLQASRDYQMDLAWQADDPFRRTRRLVAFDMDSTLIQAEVIVELAKEAGVGELVHEVTEAAMRGEIDFDESLRRRVSHLEGLPESVLEKVANRLVLTEGAERLISNLKHLGYKTAVLSGGFTYFGQFLKAKLGLDHVCANELEIIDGKLTGKVVGEIVNAEKKAELLGKIADEEGINLHQTIAIGDGANDLAMLGAAGLGIAFHAKPIVQESAEHRISTMGLDGVLYFVGVRDRELLEACNEAD